MNSTFTAEAAAQLHQGITLLLDRWTALQMAVANEWGGRDSHQKPAELANGLFHRLTQSKEQVYMDDLEELLDAFMDTLNTTIDDGSIEEIAEKLMFMREECLEGNFDSIKKLKETNAPALSYVQQPAGDGAGSSTDASSDDNSAMEVDEVQHQQIPNQNNITNEPSTVVDDGWTVVSSNRNRGKRT